MQVLSKIRFYFQHLVGVLVTIALCLIPLVWSREVNANYFTTKLVLLYITGGLCFLYLALSSRKEFWSRTTHTLGLLGMIMVAWHVAYAFIFNYPISLYLLPKLVAFLAIFIFLVAADFQWDYFLKKYEWVFLLVFLILLGLTVNNFIELVNQYGYLLRWQFVEPFGNVNMMSEFYVLVIPFLHLWVTKPFRIPQWLKWTVFILVHSILIVANSRSAYIGLTLWWMWYCFRFIEGRRRFVFMLLVPVFFWGVTKAHGLYADNNSTDKTDSTVERLNFYYSTADLILDHPLGIGLKFSNAIVPYRLSYEGGPNESQYPDQPHSEVLKWGAQFGWPGLAFSFLILFWIAYTVFFKTQSFLLQGAVLVLAPQIVFQFPFENPASTMVVSFMLYSFYRALPSKKAPFHFSFHILGVILSTFLLWQAWAYWIPVFQTSQFPNDLTKTTEACELNPSYLPGCIMKNYNLIQTRDFVKSKENYLRDSADNYYHVDYLKILISYLFERGKSLPAQHQQVENFTKLCQALHVYGIIFKNQKYFSQADTKNCQRIPKPFEFNNPQQFSEDFKKWFATILD